jgi:EAL domain-containing protein (putative c-di-GMP-specific phosphodiesterase class I)
MARSDTVLFDSLAAGASEAGDAVVQRALAAIRAHLGMDIAYISQFVGDEMILREVDAPGQAALAKVGDAHSLNDTYCRDILAGRLPELMPNTAAVPLAAAKPITAALPIGRHMSVPVRLADGSDYGMFCCLGFTPDESLYERDLAMMRAFADLAAFEINRDVETKKALDEARMRINAVMGDQMFSIVYQPIVDLVSGKPIGLECLSRFQSGGPDTWFAEAADVGLGVALELAAITKALSVLSFFPDSVYLAVNASPDTILSGGLGEIMSTLPGHRLVLEVTEHANVDDYDALRAALKPMRDRGVSIAIDDAGAGYSSLRHILTLEPDLIKLDMSLTRNIGLDPARKALAAALISFARETGSRIIAEGVETAEELATLRELGVEKAQGYFLGRPTPIDAALRLFEAPDIADVA